MEDRLARQLRFILELDQLKRVLRCSLITGGSRRENSAEHCWHFALAALVLAEHANEPVDALRAAKLGLVHDIVEIDAGDVNVYDTAARAAQAEKELAAAERLFGLLPADQAAEFRALWDEFEHGDTPEARFARALDRVLPVMLNYHTAGQAWREHGATADQVRGVNSKIALGSEALWERIAAWLDDAVAQGWLV